MGYSLFVDSAAPVPTFAWTPSPVSTEGCSAPATSCTHRLPEYGNGELQVLAYDGGAVFATLNSDLGVASVMFHRVPFASAVPAESTGWIALPAGVADVPGEAFAACSSDGEVMVVVSVHPNTPSIAGMVDGQAVSLTTNLVSLLSLWGATVVRSGAGGPFVVCYGGDSGGGARALTVDLLTGAQAYAYTPTYTNSFDQFGPVGYGGALFSMISHYDNPPNILVSDLAAEALSGTAVLSVGGGEAGQGQIYVAGRGADRTVVMISRPVDGEPDQFSIVTYDRGAQEFGTQRLASEAGIPSNGSSGTLYQAGPDSTVTIGGPVIVLGRMNTTTYASFDAGVTYHRVLAPVGNLLPRYIWDGSRVLNSEFFTAFIGTYEVPGYIGGALPAPWSPRSAGAHTSATLMVASLVTSGGDVVILGTYALQLMGADIPAAGREVWFRWVSDVDYPVEIGYAPAAGAAASGVVDVFTQGAFDLINVGAGGWDNGTEFYNSFTAAVGMTYYFRIQTDSVRTGDFEMRIGAA